MPTRRGSQLVLEWADAAAVQWDELAAPTRRELQALLCDLLRQAAGRLAPAAEGRGNE